MMRQSAFVSHIYRARGLDNTRLSVLPMCCFSPTPNP